MQLSFIKKRPRTSGHLDWVGVFAILVALLPLAVTLAASSPLHSHETPGTKVCTLCQFQHMGMEAATEALQLPRLDESRCSLPNARCNVLLAPPSTIELSRAPPPLPF